MHLEGDNGRLRAATGWTPRRTLLEMVSDKSSKSLGWRHEQQVMKTISIISPCFNEADNVRAC